MFKTAHQNETSTLSTLQNVANKTASVKTESKSNSAPRHHQTEDGAFVTYLQVSFQVIVLQGLEGTRIHLHCFGMEDHLDGYKV